MFQSKCKFPYPTQLSIFAWSILWRRASIVIFSFSWRQNIVWHNFLVIFWKIVIVSSIWWSICQKRKNKRRKTPSWTWSPSRSCSDSHDSSEWVMLCLMWFLLAACLSSIAIIKMFNFFKGTGGRQRGLSRRSVQSPQTSTKSDLRFGKLETAVCPLAHSLSVQRQHQERQWECQKDWQAGHRAGGSQIQTMLLRDVEKVDLFHTCPNLIGGYGCQHKGWEERHSGAWRRNPASGASNCTTGNRSLFDCN